jgi:hypothetical protein
VLLDLAVAKARADHRLALTEARMDALKSSPEPLTTKPLLNLLGRGPKELADFSNELFGRKASVVMTNVVGPARGALPRRRADRPHPALGATPRQATRDGSQHPELPRHGLADRDRRRPSGALPRSHHARVLREFDKMLKRATAGAAKTTVTRAPALRSPAA